MLAFLFGFVLGVLLATIALLGVGVWLMLRGGSRHSAAHVLHAVALALKQKPSPLNHSPVNEVVRL